MIEKIITTQIVNCQIVKILFPFLFVFTENKFLRQDGGKLEFFKNLWQWVYVILLVHIFNRTEST